ADRLPGHHEIVGGRVVASQGQFESALAGQGTVTGPGIAADLGHGRNHMIAKAWGERFLGADNLDSGSSAFAAVCGGNERLAIADGPDNAAAVNAGYRWIGGAEFGLATQVADDLTVVLDECD